MSMADLDDNAVIDFDEFARYMLRHERRLQIAFTSLDKNNDGNQTIRFKFKLSGSWSSKLLPFFVDLYIPCLFENMNFT